MPMPVAIATDNVWQLNWLRGTGKKWNRRGWSEDFEGSSPARKRDSKFEQFMLQVNKNLVKFMIWKEISYLKNNNKEQDLKVLKKYSFASRDFSFNK